MTREGFANLCVAPTSKEVGREALFHLLSIWEVLALESRNLQKAENSACGGEREGQGGRSSGIIRKVLGTECYIFLVLESPATVTEWAHSSPREHLGHWVITFLWSDSTQQLDTFINFTTRSLGALCFLFSSAGKLEEYRKCKTEGNWQKEQSRSCWKTPCWGIELLAFSWYLLGPSTQLLPHVSGT